MNRLGRTTYVEDVKRANEREAMERMSMNVGMALGEAQEGRQQPTLGEAYRTLVEIDARLMALGEKLNGPVLSPPPPGEVAVQTPRGLVDEIRQRVSDIIDLENRILASIDRIEVAVGDIG